MLFDTPDNQAPPKATAGLMKATDGRRIRFAYFPADGRPLKGTVVILQGRNETIEKYFETIRDLSARGLGVATFDFRGQGGSDRLTGDPMRGHVRDFRDYVGDLNQFFGEIVLPDCRGPYYVLGHSTGSLVGLLAAPHLVNRVERMVLIAPLLALHGASMPTLKRVSGLLCALGLGRIYMSGKPRRGGSVAFEDNKLTSDPVRFARNRDIVTRHRELALGGPTAAWMHAACRAMEAVHDPDFLARLQIPILMVAAGHDQVVSTQAIEEYARYMKSGSLLTVDCAEHEILQEHDIFREQFFAAFDAFVPGTRALAEVAA